MTHYPTTYGNKYNPELTIAQIAKRVKADIVAAIKKGELPALKASVTTRSFTGGRSLRVCITRFDGAVLNPNRVYEEMEAPFRSTPTPRLTPEASAALRFIRDICDAYNFNGSDIVSDYFHVNFYETVEFDWNLESKEQARIMANAHLDDVRGAA